MRRNTYSTLAYVDSWAKLPHPNFSRAKCGVGEFRLLAHGAQLLLSLAEDLDPPVRARDMLFARGRTCSELLGLVQLLAVGAQVRVRARVRVRVRVRGRGRVRVRVRVRV